MQSDTCSDPKCGGTYSTSGTENILSANSVKAIEIETMRNDSNKKDYAKYANFKANVRKCGCKYIGFFVLIVLINFDLSPQPFKSLESVSIDAVSWLI